MNRALLLVPPVLKYAAGPLAGPAALAGVAEKDGHPLDHVDWNNHELQPQLQGSARIAGVCGDHARDRGLDAGAEAWWTEVRAAMPELPPERTPGLDPVGAAAVSFEVMEQTARRLAVGAPGERLGALLPDRAPTWVGMSVLWSGQVYGALAATLVVKGRWPGVPVVWGGPHVTALLPEIAADPHYGPHIDGFVGGYAEASFADLLASGGRSARGLVRAGSGEALRGEEAPGLSAFGDLSGYGHPTLVLPAQASRGCAYGRCRFCTYPSVEGGYRRLSLDGLAHATAEARRRGASLAIKDAFATAPVLEAVAGVVKGQVRWSACTRPATRLGRARLDSLVEAGLATLELGVESVDPETLAAMDKRQSRDQVEGLMSDAEGLDLHLVLNLMAGFPGQSEAAAAAELEWARGLAARYPRARFSTERNLLEVERRSPLAADPGRYGIRLTGEWPWASVLDWDAPPWRSRRSSTWQTHQHESAR
jgi:hypothetical protein